MASSSSSSTNLSSSVITPEPYLEASKTQDVSSLLRKETTSEVMGSGEAARSIVTSSSNHQISNDATSSSTDIPQWKKDLIQRRKTNIAKTIAANQITSIAASSSKASISTATLGAQPLTSDLKNSSIATAANANNNCDKLLMRTSNANTNSTHEIKINTSQQHSFGSAVNVNNALKMPGTIQQQKDESESSSTSCGGHYTQVNNKSSGGSPHNYNDKLAARTASVIQQQTEQTPAPALAPLPVTRSFGIGIGIVEQKTNDGSSTQHQAQENVRFRKNLTEPSEATNTTSSDSLITSTSRLSSSLKVAAAAEIYKKPNKDNLNVCASVSNEQQTHTLQEPALTTNVSNNNGSGGGDDEQQLHHQLKSEHESDNLVVYECANSTSSTKEIVDSNIFPINNNANGVNSLSQKNILSNKKSSTCGISGAGASVKSSLSSQFLKNQKTNNSTLVSSHHNYKINNNKYRLNQNLTSPSCVSATSSAIESPTTVTNNKKKMVAVQEMNEISNNELDFDPSEELQYGPGIVSKLRCRYLSLALRQSMGKQRLSMDTLRRATSLNNLLDDNGVHDEDEEEYAAMGIRNKEATSPTPVAAVSRTENKGTAAKLTEPTSGFNKNVKNHSGERTAGTNLEYNNQHRSRHIKRGNDSLKRARSVEALLCEKSPWNFSESQTTNLNNGTDAVTIEDKINNARDRLLLGTDCPPKRLTSIIDDTERPPPDLVKQTLKIFEASANRRVRSHNRNSGGEVATKVANYKSIITQNKPTITFPKPPVSPKKTILKKPPTDVKKTTALTPPTTPTAIVSMQTEKDLVPLSSTPATSSRTTAAFRQKVDFTPIRNSGCVSGASEGLSETSPDIIPRHKLLDKTLPTSKPVDSPVTELAKKIEKLRIESPGTTPTQQQQQAPRKELQSRFSAESSDRDSEDDDSIDGEYVVNNDECDLTKRVSKADLENIAKAGTSQQFQFTTKSPSVLANGSSIGRFSENLHDIPTLSTTGSTTVKQIGVIRPLLPEPPQIIDNSIIRCNEENPIVPTASPLTSREIEKNRINNAKKIEKSGMDELGCVGLTKVNKINKVSSNTSASDSDHIAQTSAWSSAIITKKKRNPLGAASENNTMVFNFKDRKEVPDYIENDGLIFKRKRELPKPNESGFVLLGDLSLETSTDPDDEWPMCPPSPCDVEFENANIIIDGKSSIRNRPKDAQFRVQFDDTLTSTFEYPSESSVIEDSGSDYADFNSSRMDETSQSSAASMPIPTIMSHATDSPVVHHHVTVDEIIQLPHNNKVGNLSLGSAPLGSYTPVKAKIENIFQLGVTRVPNNNQSDLSNDEVQSKEILPTDFYEELDNRSLEYLKPASDDLTIAYSEGSLKTDLLY